MAELATQALGKDLATTPLANVLITALKQKATGELRIRHPAGEDRIYFRSGVPAGTQVMHAFKPLGRMLLELGWINNTQFEASVAQMESGKRQGDALVEMGALVPQKLTLALQMLQLRNLVEIAKLADGEFLYEHNAPAPSWVADVPLNALRILREVLAVPQSDAVCQSLFQKIGADALVVIPPHLVSTSSHFEFEQPELVALKLLESPMTIQQFFARSHLPDDRSRALVAELVVCNLLVPPDQAVPKGAERLVQKVDDKSRERRRRMLDRAIANVGVGPFNRNRTGAPVRPEPASGGHEAPPDDSQSNELPEMEDAVAPPIESADDRKTRVLIEERGKLMPTLDFYGRLGLTPSANKEQVKNAFVQSAKLFHPDHLPASLGDLANLQRDIFTAIKEAYDTLSDDQRAREYRASRPSILRAASGTVPASAANRAREEESKIFAAQGDLALRKKDYATAAESFRQAHELFPKGDYAAKEAWSLFTDPARKSDQKRARELLEGAARNHPDSAKAAQFMGSVKRMDGDPVEAESWLRKALEIDPRNLEAANELHLLELRKRQK